MPGTARSDDGHAYLYEAQLSQFAVSIAPATPRTFELRCFGLVRDACLTGVTAVRTFDQAARRKLLHLQIIKGLCLVDQNFELLPVPCFST
jgi:hypothetical protein